MLLNRRELCWFLYPLLVPIDYWLPLMRAIAAPTENQAHETANQFK